MQATLLVELVTEELPPKSLRRLAGALASNIHVGLGDRALVDSIAATSTSYATPRRLAVKLTNVFDRTSERHQTKKLMPVNVAFGADGKLTEALLKRLEKEGAGVEHLERRTENNIEYVFLTKTFPGITLSVGLQATLNEAIRNLPTQKRMRYQRSGATITGNWINSLGEKGPWVNAKGQLGEFFTDTVEFVRPAHSLLALHGDEVVDVSVLGLKAGRVTYGHRFLASGPIFIEHVDDYERALREEGKVEVNFETRRSKIKEELKRAETELAGQIARKPDGHIPINVKPLVIDTERTDAPGHIFPATPNFNAIQRALDCSGGSALLDEVTALVEWPRAYWGYFDEKFLDIPVECLALTMKRNQRYFPVFDTSATLLPYFVVIANIDESNTEENAGLISKNIVSGNERVLRPRLADARFFFEQDKKIRLEDRVPLLTNVVYHSKLGNQLERTKRVQLLAEKIARDIAANVEFAELAAWLSKADLLTEMVGEFPELQGTMGRYYAIHDNKPETVANAIEAHYRPRFAGDRLPEGLVASAVSLADKLETIVGLFSVGEQPTGERDPFGIRRATIGCIRILIEGNLAIRWHLLIDTALDLFQPSPSNAFDITTSLYSYWTDRLRNYLVDLGHPIKRVDAALGGDPWRLDLIIDRLDAIKEFEALPEANSLSAANKRIKNILKKTDYRDGILDPHPGIKKEPAEKALFETVLKLSLDIDKQLAQKQDRQSFTQALITLAKVREPVDRFFDEVLVMSEDDKVRENRIAMLGRLARLMNRVADISMLSA